MKLSALADQAEKLFFEAYRAQGWEFVLEQPMWFTWSFERFGESTQTIPFSVNHPPPSTMSISQLRLSDSLSRLAVPTSVSAQYSPPPSPLSRQPIHRSTNTLRPRQDCFGAMEGVG